MFKTVFLVLLFIHILGDYYFQSEKHAQQKITSFNDVIRHCSFYIITCLLVIIPIYSEEILVGSIALAVSHGIIDISKFFLLKRLIKKGKYTAETERIVYIIDQVLHLLFIIIIAFVFVVYKLEVVALPAINLFFEIIELSGEKTFIWLFAFLLIWKPANISIKKLLSAHKPIEINDDNNQNCENTKKTGGFIGLLERLIILILLSINQYSAIGLVLTAKSIARYDKISKEQGFAEYYLLGTLLSTLIVILMYLLLMLK